MNKKMLRDAFWFPALVLVFILLAALADKFCHPPFNAALVPLAVGGGYVCVSTISSVWRSHEVGTGLLVVLALIATVFTGEYMEGAEVAFMLLLGEGLEDYAMARGQAAVDGLLSALSPKARRDCEDFFHQESGLERLTDQFSRYFLPLILCICLLVFFLTRDIHRVMSILVIACPCSLVLSGPAAVLASVENAARNEVLWMSRSEEEMQACRMRLLRRTRAVIWENILLFAFLMNLIGITLSGFGLLPIVLGAVIHNLSTVCVFLNSARLLRS